MAKEYALVEVSFNAWDGNGKKIFICEKWKIVVLIPFAPFGGLIQVAKNQIKKILLEVYGLGQNNEEPKVEINEYRCGEIKVLKRYEKIEIRERDYLVIGRNFSVYDKVNGVMLAKSINIRKKVSASSPKEAERIVVNLIKSEAKKIYNREIELYEGIIVVQIAVDLSTQLNSPKQLSLFEGK